MLHFLQNLFVSLSRPIDLLFKPEELSPPLRTVTVILLDCSPLNFDFHSVTHLSELGLKRLTHHFPSTDYGGDNDTLRFEIGQKLVEIRLLEVHYQSVTGF